MRCEDFPGLSMAWLDDEMEADERRSFEEHLRNCPACRAELELLRGVKEVTIRMKLADLEDREWRRYGTHVYNRIERGTGWVLLSLGAIVTLGYGMWGAFADLLRDDSLPVVVRAGIGCALLGVVILFVGVVRQRLHSWRRDPYRGVER
ncbi:MAG: zf-HC2 domain-containing protein [Candidatus Eisenbacteria bacterium]